MGSPVVCRPKFSPLAPGRAALPPLGREDRGKGLARTVAGRWWCARAVTEGRPLRWWCTRAATEGRPYDGIGFLPARRPRSDHPESSDDGVIVRKSPVLVRARFEGPEKLFRVDYLRDGVLIASRYVADSQGAADA